MTGVEQFPAIRADRIPRLKPPVEKAGAVVYCRVSTPDQANNFSLSTQEAECRKYCERRGYTISKVFVEPGESAKSTERPQFQEMLKYCAENKRTIGAVVVYQVNRFARNARDHLNIREQLRKDNIRLLSVTQELDDRTAQGRLSESFLAVQAQYDNDQRSETTKAAMKRAMEDGKWCHQAPTGYINANIPGGLSQDPKRAPLVLKAFELYGDGNRSKKWVLDAINEMGLRTRGGRKISAQTLDKMLRNPCYAAWITSSYGIPKRGKFEPIVGIDLFNRVQDKLCGKTSGTRQLRTRENPEFPLRVFARCAECGRSLTGSFSTSRSGRRYPYYCCHQPICRAVKFRRDKLHHEFHQLLYALAPDERFMALFNGIVRDVWQNKHAECVELVAQAEQAIAALKAKDQKLIDMFVEGDLDKETYEDQRKRVGTALEKVRARQADTLLPFEQVDSLLEFAEWMLGRIAGIWNSADDANKRRIQDALFPEGVSVSRQGFGTAQPCLFFRQFPEIEIEKSNLASPGGFEPPLPP